MQKLCKDCGQMKPLTEFHSDKSREDGHGFYCKPCTRARMRRPKVRPPKVKAPPGLKHCTRCQTTKPLEEFSKSSASYDGHDRRCKQCNYELHEAWRQKNLAKAAADQKRWREENTRRWKDTRLKAYYGVPLGWYEQRLAAQNGGCAICGSLSPGGKGDFHIDHCHTTKQVRGLLCHHCNLAIGNLRESPKIAEAAREYLLQYKKGGA